RENDNPGNADGLYYYRARYYMPGCMRFISEDPIGWASGQTNNYGYVGGRPLDRMDPSGNFVIILPALPAIGGWVAGAIGAGLGAWLGWNVVGPMVRDATSPDPGGTQTCSRAKVPPNVGPPGGWVQGPHRGRQYGPDGKPAYDIDEPHQGFPEPHVHEWEDGVREHPGRPVTPWSPDTPIGGPVGDSSGGGGSGCASN
ncbi:MAG TPA: RHS repeat-associated core domain-containing protein, partial [Ideonella sp.]|uniref:RHS repeat-associated core domain-containing protein n=1 Tax=Ideonella sp. TaxID=1929293 RepID=UPI002E36DCFF